MQSYQHADRKASPVSAGAIASKHLPSTSDSFLVSPSLASPDMYSSARNSSISETSSSSANFQSHSAVSSNNLESVESSHSLASNFSSQVRFVSNFAELEYPTPKLYDLALKLNSDPGLHEFWNNLTEILENVYMAKRASLVVPNDLTDISNTPWGLKGVWTSQALPWALSRLQHHRSSQTAQSFDRDSEELNLDKEIDNTDDDSEWEDTFEDSEGEHISYDHESGESVTQSIRSEYEDTVTDDDDERISQSSHNSAVTDDGRLPFLSRRQTGVERGTAKIYCDSRPLESDVDPLIDSLGVSRVLHRGKVALLQREYRNLETASHLKTSESKDRNSSRPVALADLRKQSTVSNASDASTITERPSLAHRNAFSKAKPRPKLRDPFGDTLGANAENPIRNLPYEDYEQCILSPWSHSPAPSPALSKDSKENPFFSTSTQSTVEEAFDSADDGPDTSPLAEFNMPVRAIGLESCYSVIHIPLVHPSLARPVRNTTSLRQGRQSIVPIAIISILSDVIPYPVNLVKSISTFAPHVSASFTLAEAHANLKYQVERSKSLHSRIYHGDRKSRGGVVYGYSRKSSTSSNRSYSGSVSTSGSYFGLNRLSDSASSSRTSTPTWESANSTITDSSFGITGSLPAGGITNAGSYSSTTMSTNASLSDSPDVESPKPSKVPYRYRAQGKSAAAIPHLGSSSPPPKSPVLSFSSSSSPAPVSVYPNQATSQQRPHVAPRREDSMAENHSYMSTPPPRLLRTIIDSIPVHLHIADPTTGAITWVSARTLAYCGLSPDEYCRQPAQQRFHPDDQQIFMRAWKTALKNGDPLSLQLRMRRFDGVYRFFVVRAVPLRDSKGSIVHWFGTNMDIHEQRIAELESIKQSEKLASERKYRTLAESSPLIVFAATRSDGIIYANNQWSYYSGQSIANCQRFGFLEFVYPEDRQKCILPMTEETQTFSCELRLRDANGNYKWHIVRCVSSGEQNSTDSSPDTPGIHAELMYRNLPGFPIDATPICPSGDPVWFGTCTDINDHKLIEEKLQEAKDAAQRTMESKARFLSNMSHEIRTPLIGISGMVNFLLDTTLTSEQLDYCHTISSSSEALLSVINDILDLSKAEAGKMRLNKEWFNIRWLIEDANELLSTLAISKNLELNYIVNEDVPAIVNGDRIRIRQVLLNIIGNAIKFTSRGEIFTRCSVEKQGADTILLHFECHDTGAGFTKEDEILMFKPFSQIDGTMTRKHGGSGLGLVISKQLIELHGGTVSCRGEKDKGSTFYFSAEFGLPTSEDSPGLSPILRSGMHRYSSGSSSSSETRQAMLDMHSPFSLRPGAIASVLQVPGTATTPGLMSGSPASEYPMIFSDSSRTPLPNPESAAPDSTHILAMTAEHIKQLKPAKDPQTMRFRIPSDPHKHREGPSGSDSSQSNSFNDLSPVIEDGKANRTFALIVCEYHFSTEAIIYHIREALPADHTLETAHVTNYASAVDLLATLGSKPPTAGDRQPFTHIVINVTDYTEIAALTVKVFSNPAVFSKTKVIAVTTPMQKTAIMQNLRAYAAGLPSAVNNQEPTIATVPGVKSLENKSVKFNAGSDGLVDYSVLDREMGVRFFYVSKPLKMSRLSAVFKPRTKSSSTRSFSHSGSGTLDETDEMKPFARFETTDETATPKRKATGKQSIFRELHAAVEGHKHRVLLVEDNPVNQKVLQTFLERGGLKVDTVSDGEECVQKVYNSEPAYYSLIVCDLHMPRKDGFQTCAEIRRWEDVNGFGRRPIIALSANVMSDVAEKCQLVGFSRYVSKPIDFVVFKGIFPFLLLCILILLLMEIAAQMSLLIFSVRILTLTKSSRLLERLVEERK